MGDRKWVGRFGRLFPLRRAGWLPLGTRLGAGISRCGRHDSALVVTPVDKIPQPRGAQKGDLGLATAGAIKVRLRRRIFGSAKWRLGSPGGVCCTC